MLPALTMSGNSQQDKVKKTIDQLTQSQIEWVDAVIGQFVLTHNFELYRQDFLNEEVLERLGDALRIHHAFSRQALSKDRFEFALERSFQLANITAELCANRTNRGHDITVQGVPVSLKTEAAANIKRDKIHVSKWMELGQGKWRLDLLRDLFLDHLDGYDRIFTLRRLIPGPEEYEYELIEVPKDLLLESVNADLQVSDKSTQSPKPGYGYVRDKNGNLKYSLYFDGGSEQKLQIKHLEKSRSIKHASWKFASTEL